MCPNLLRFYKLMENFLLKIDETFYYFITRKKRQKITLTRHSSSSHGLPEISLIQFLQAVAPVNKGSICELSELLQIIRDYYFFCHWTDKRIKNLVTNWHCATSSTIKSNSAALLSLCSIKLICWRSMECFPGSGRLPGMEMVKQYCIKYDVRILRPCQYKLRSGSCLVLLLMHICLWRDFAAHGLVSFLRLLLLLQTATTIFRHRIHIMHFSI